MPILKLTDLDLKGKRVFIRADLNVPQDDNGAITDDTRIRASVAGIQHALESRCGGHGDLAPGPPDRGRIQAGRLARAGGEAAGRTARTSRCRYSRTGSTACEVAPGEVVLLENCRVNKGEKKNDDALAKKMAALCDIYVNDAFGTAHRAEATTHGIAKFAKVACAGPLMAAEIDALTRALGNPQAAAGRDRRRLEGVDQAHHPRRARREGRSVDRRRRHRQHFHARRRHQDRQIARRTRLGG